MSSSTYYATYTAADEITYLRGLLFGAAAHCLVSCKGMGWVGRGPNPRAFLMAADIILRDKRVWDSTVDVAAVKKAVRELWAEYKALRG